MKTKIIILSLLLFAPAIIFSQTKEELDALEKALDQSVENILTTFCSNMNKQLPVFINECELLSSVFFVAQNKTMVMNYNILDDCRFRSKKVMQKKIAAVKVRLIGDMFFNKNGISKDAEPMIQIMELFDIKLRMVYRDENSTKIFGYFFINHDDIVNEAQKKSIEMNTL